MCIVLYLLLKKSENQGGETKFGQEEDLEIRKAKASPNNLFFFIPDIL